MSGPEVFPFEVVPAPDAGADFDPFVMDVPSLSGLDFAARRAWWSAFHLLGPRGVEPEDFEVYRFEDETRGQRVYSGGLESGS